jgi:hypothetical protein
MKTNGCSSVASPRSSGPPTAAALLKRCHRPLRGVSYPVEDRLILPFSRHCGAPNGKAVRFVSLAASRSSTRIQWQLWSQSAKGWN